MINFTDLLNRPLPSKRYMTESEDGSVEDNKKAILDSSNDLRNKLGGNQQALKTAGLAKEDGDDSDENIADEVSDVVNPSDPTDAIMMDDLSTDDEVVSQKIDDTIQRVATPIMLNSEMSAEEVDNFVESVDCDIATSEQFLSERTIVKFDKKARYAQLHKTAVLAIAKEKNDPKFRKLRTLWKLEAVLEKQLNKQYGSQANARVKIYLQKARNSKSNIIKRVANKITGKK